MNLVPGEGRLGLSFQRVPESETLAAALPTEPPPSYIFQSAEFFEMLEKMQVSTPKVQPLILRCRGCRVVGVNTSRWLGGTLSPNNLGHFAVE